MRRLLLIIKGLILVAVVDSAKYYYEFYRELFLEIINACEKRVSKDAEEAECDSGK